MLGVAGSRPATLPLIFLPSFMNNWNYPFTPDEWQSCLKVLQHLSCEPYDAPELERMKTLVTKIYKQARKVRQQASRIEDGHHDRAAKACTGRVQQENGIDLSTTPKDELKRPVACYVCRESYRKLHFFYHRLCPDCAEFNYQKRVEQPLDLTGRYAIVTGGRIKVGYQTALNLLRAGANVIVSSRFPANAATVYAAEPDYKDWADRLQLVGLDLLNLGRLENWIEEMNQRLPQLDILVNNAAQTLWRPPEYYTSLLAVEQRLLPSLNNTRLLTGQSISQAQNLPAPILQEPADPREINSWMLELQEIPAREMLEAQVINSVAPAMLCSGLRPLLIKSPHPARFIINVASAEGQFSYPLKTTTHAHTNMAKAGLNMLTRTSAKAYAQHNIYMNAVDVGWISPETPEPLNQVKIAAGFVPPLDALDAAARIFDPIRQGLTAKPIWGQLLKNYQPTSW